MDFIKRIFESKETNCVLSALENLNYYYKSNSLNRFDSFTIQIWKSIYKGTKKNIYKNSKSITKIIKNKEEEPEILLYNYVLTEAYDSIVHKYRGALRDFGEICKKNIFYLILNRLKEANAISDEEMKNVKNNLEDDMRNSFFNF